MPGNRSTSGSRAPRLGLAIPPMANGKPLNNPNPEAFPNAHPVRPPLPQLRLATPMGSHSTPQTSSVPNGKPVVPLATLQTGNLGGGEGSHGRSDSSSLLDSREGRASGPTSAASQYSALSFAMGLRQPQGTPDPSSAAGSTYSDRGGGGSDGGSGMDREESMNGLPDLDKLSLEKGRPLDVEDLDDAAWRAVSMEKRIVELGSLGEELVGLSQGACSRVARRYSR